MGKKKRKKASLQAIAPHTHSYFNYWHF